MLREAVGHSRERHYHGEKGIQVLSPEGQATTCSFLPIQ